MKKISLLLVMLFLSVYSKASSQVSAVTVTGVGSGGPGSTIPVTFAVRDSGNFSTVHYDILFSTTNSPTSSSYSSFLKGPMVCSGTDSGFFFNDGGNPVNTVSKTVTAPSYNYSGYLMVIAVQGLPFIQCSNAFAVTTFILVPTPTATATSTFTNTFTNAATNTFTVTATNTRTNTGTNTFTMTATNTANTSTNTNTRTNTFTSTVTNTGTNTFTPTTTNTVTNTVTMTVTKTATITPTFTFTPTFTTQLSPGIDTLSREQTQLKVLAALSNLNTLVPTSTYTSTFTSTFTFTPTKTATFTNTGTSTFTNTITFTPTQTFTSTLPVANIIASFTATATVKVIHVGNYSLNSSTSTTPTPVQTAPAAGVYTDYRVNYNNTGTIGGDWGFILGADTYPISVVAPQGLATGMAAAQFIDYTGGVTAAIRGPSAASVTINLIVWCTQKNWQTQGFLAGLPPGFNRVDYMAWRYLNRQDFALLNPRTVGFLPMTERVNFGGAQSFGLVE